MFRILNIETHERPDFQRIFPVNTGRQIARYESVMRVLHANMRYDFYQPDSHLPEEFVSEGTPEISISAIVGENGMGKSSLIELLLRIVNNAGYALRSGIEDSNSDHPRYVRGVYATLTFEDEEGHHQIVVDDCLVKFKTNDVWIWEYDFNKRDREDAITFHQVGNTSKSLLEKLFYTVVVNYSMYSYNTNDYMPEYTEHDELDKDDKAEEMLEEDYCWLNSVFHKNDGYQFPLVLNPFRSAGIIDVNNERVLTQNRVFLMALADESPLNDILQDKKPFSFIFDIRTQYNPVYGTKYGCQNARFQMQYLRIINNWRDRSEKIDELGSRIIEIWSRCIGYQLDAEIGCADKQFDMNDRKRALNYVVYKTIKISQVYGKYKTYQDALRNITLEDKKGNNLLEVYIKLLHDDNTHVTLKLFRALAFLVFGHYGTTIKPCCGEKKLGKTELYLKDFGRRIESCQQWDGSFCGTDELVPTAERYLDLKTHQWKKEELLPASSIEARMMLEVNNPERPEDRYVSIASLSSGERQVIHLLCTVMYHLFNLKSNWQNGNEKDHSIRYKHVNIIFDEMELYFHPKYQTQLIEKMLKGIKSMFPKENDGGVNQWGVEGINIMFSTHSPFILSDIPKQNILGMKQGWPAELDKIHNTFCANVYDILASGFFMDKFVGDFAESKFDGIVKRLNNDEALTGEERKRLVKTIALIGDDYLRRKLSELLAEEHDTD